MKRLLILLSVTTIADTFLHKGNVGRVINYPIYDAIHEKDFTREQPMHLPNVS